MSSFKSKLYDFKDRLRSGKMFTVVITLILIIVILAVYALNKSLDYRRMAENSYNQAFYELVEYANNTEQLLAKSTISNSKEHAAKILTSTWKTASLAQTYLSFLPIETSNLEQSQKFLNQVSDFCFSLSKKCIDGEDLSDDDISNLSSLHEYSVSLVNTINQLESDLFDNSIRWGELTSKGDGAFQSEDENLSKVTFSNIEEDLHQYTGLIYDGAFSENRSIFNGKGLTGDDVSIDVAKDIAIKFVGSDKIDKISSSEEITITNSSSNSYNSYSNDSEKNDMENATSVPNSGNSINASYNNVTNATTDNSADKSSDIACFKFSLILKNSTTAEILLLKKGGHVISYNCEREVYEQSISHEEACNIGKSFLDSTEFKSMKETYYMEQSNILTINYAFYSNDVICYPDLVKVKVALDNGEILGVEAKNYLNNHGEDRNFDKYSISLSDATSHINKNLTIKSVDRAIIPTEWNTEIACYEVKGNAYGNDFIVFINGETGKEEDILMIINTEEGTLTT